MGPALAVVHFWCPADDKDDDGVSEMLPRREAPLLRKGVKKLRRRFSHLVERKELEEPGLNSHILISAQATNKVFCLSFKTYENMGCIDGYLSRPFLLNMVLFRNDKFSLLIMSV